VNKVDRELAQIEARKAEESGRAPVAKSGLRASVKRVAKDMLVRRTSTKQ